jgi:hypothetical protein
MKWPPRASYLGDNFSPYRRDREEGRERAKAAKEARAKEKKFDGVPSPRPN